MLLPLLTEADPETSSEGSIDPLGVYAIADSLGVRLAPGVRERQSHPRFLTAMAVASAVCCDFDDDAVAKDGVSPPWQVFEWYLVEGLVRTLRGTREEIRGLPGVDKATSAIDEGVPLSARRYLKTPSVFGFHGVYRVLADELDIVRDGRLGETGYNLVLTWANEQRLTGFFDSKAGPGRAFRDMLRSAIEDGIEKGAVARSTAWQGWNFFRDHLAPYRFERGEAQVIIDSLIRGTSGYRSEIIRFMASKTGESLCREVVESGKSEGDFHSGLITETGGDLRSLLKAIQAYERFARLLQDAFEDCLYEMTKTRGKTSPADLSKRAGVQKASQLLPDLFPAVADLLSPFGETYRFQEQFAEVSARGSAETWVVSLIDHHRRIQMQKPPNGKNPWFERFDDGSVVIRPGYLRYEGGSHDGRYVNAYRTRPLWSFIKDLGMVHGEE
ncbi:MAG: hypothetical protein CVU57_01025 [Deltaproteobacteria bacterium HGW-Deltaproteobacteria-15]|jgi:hypothetical protein|nr:MAG: hypothetical protein CVU57_01025 [Deltaproteobacteria bacterium HGW-Deltaproteobacteria-15]